MHTWGSVGGPLRGLRLALLGKTSSLYNLYLYSCFDIFGVLRNFAADMLDTAGPASAASTGAKKATLQKLMSFDMMEPDYTMISLFMG
jgi:hypothetical protein